jgi:integrase
MGIEMEAISRLQIASRKYDATKSKLEALLSKKDLKTLSGFDQAMTIDGLTPSRKSTILDCILRMTRLLDHKEWNTLDVDGMKSLVAKVMYKYAKNGKETNTTQGSKKALQQWFRFLKTGYRTAKDCEIELGFKNPKETRRISIGKVDDSVTAEDLVTREELKKLLKGCDNLRDKALIHAVDDGGFRPHELLELQIKHVKSDKNGFTLLIKKTAKTGAREVRVIEATTSLADWLNVHPSGHDMESPLFVNTGNTNYGEELTQASASKVLKTLCKKVGVRPLHFYLFRHTETTRRASKLSDQDNKSRHGHTKNSQAYQKYVHLTAKNSNDSLLKSYGLEPEDEELETMPQICSGCQRANSQDREICYCGKALSIEKAVMMDKEDNQKITALENQMENVLKAFAPLAEMLNQKEVGIPMKFFPKEVQQQLEERFNHN